MDGRGRGSRLKEREVGRVEERERGGERDRERKREVEKEWEEREGRRERREEDMVDGKKCGHPCTISGTHNSPLK